MRDISELKKAAEFEIHRLSVKCSDFEILKASYDDLLKDFKVSEKTCINLKKDSAKLNEKFA